MVAGLVFTDGRNLSSARLTASVRVARKLSKSNLFAVAANRFSTSDMPVF
jgi:hypothetical protein